MLFAPDERLLHSDHKNRPDFVDLNDAEEDEPVVFLFPTLPELSSRSEFLFPVDLYNYYMNAGCKHYKREQIAFNSFTGTRPSDRAETFHTRKRFLLDLANKVIEEYADRHKDYPYTVTCEDIVGAERSSLVLIFRPRKKA